MRVISGSAKGRRLKAPKGDKSRPTEDRVKESLFNILTPLKLNGVVLDLFSCSGSIGIEFLSRGAKKVYFNDWDRSNATLIRENLAMTGFEKDAVVMNHDYKKAINQLSLIENLQFDYVYLDPPYHTNYADRASALLLAQNLLSQDGLLMTERDSKAQPFDMEGYNIVDVRNYGSKSIVFYHLDSGS